MNHTTPTTQECTSPYKIDTSTDKWSRYGGIMTWRECYERLGIANLLEEAGVRYGTKKNKAAKMSYLLTTAPFVNATSQRQVSQRFGGEASENEADELLQQQLEEKISQRSLNRFVNTGRYDWMAVQQARIKQLNRLPNRGGSRKGIVILDDYPLLKPFAKEMPYLSPIWDNNLKCSLPGYAIVHLYYYHPRLASYSLGMYPWLKTSLTGETKSKGQARRPAQEGEEKSKLDIALMLVKRLLMDTSFSTLVFDGWYTVRWLLHQLTQAKKNWIGDAKSNQKFMVNGEYLTVAEIFERHQHRLQRVPGQKRRVRAIQLQAQIKPDAYTKVSQSVQLVLVTGLHKPRDKDKGYKVLVCNRCHWAVKRVIRLFSYRPQVEAEHRHGKQNAGWNDFHARSVPSLLCHLTICMLRCDMLSLFHQEIPAAHYLSSRQVIDHLIGVVVRLVKKKAAKQWIPHLNPESLLWSYYRRKTIPFY